MLSQVWDGILKLERSEWKGVEFCIALGSSISLVSSAFIQMNFLYMHVMYVCVSGSSMLRCMGNVCACGSLRSTMAVSLDGFPPDVLGQHLLLNSGISTTPARQLLLS